MKHLHYICPLPPLTGCSMVSRQMEHSASGETRSTLGVSRSRSTLVVTRLPLTAPAPERTVAEGRSQGREVKLCTLFSDKVFALHRVSDQVSRSDKEDIKGDRFPRTYMPTGVIS